MSLNLPYLDFQIIFTIQGTSTYYELSSLLPEKLLYEDYTLRLSHLIPFMYLIPSDVLHRYISEQKRSPGVHALWPNDGIRYINGSRCIYLVLFPRYREKNLTSSCCEKLGFRCIWQRQVRGVLNDCKQLYDSCELLSSTSRMANSNYLILASTFRSMINCFINLQ